MNNLIFEIDSAEQNAWNALAKYKFMMFGYWAAIWIHLNRVTDQNRPNPFRSLVKLAREHRNLGLEVKAP
jgi:hypothetical protein